MNQFPAVGTIFLTRKDYGILTCVSKQYQRIVDVWINTKASEWIIRNEIEKAPSAKRQKMGNIILEHLKAQS